MLKAFLRLTVLVCFSSSILAQALTSNSETFKNKPALVTREGPEVLGRDSYVFESILDRMLGLKDPQAKTVGVARLADLIWRYDQTRGKALFQQALDLVPTDTSDKTKAKSIRRLRQKIVVLIAKNDSVWAKRLIDDAAATESENDSQNNIAVAEGLAKDDPEAAFDFAKRSLQQRLDPSFISLLLQWRAINENQANQLFLRAVSLVAQQPGSSVGDFVLLGTYLFTSPNVDDPTSIVLTRVGNVGLANITKQRPGVGVDLIQAYLAVAVAMVSRPVADPRERQVAYAFGQLLAPKVQAYSPNLLPQLSAAMTVLSGTVPSELRQESAFENFKKTRPDDFELMAKAEKLSDTNARDITYLDVVFHAWIRRDFQTARLAADRISQEPVVSSLRTLNDFGEGAVVLARRDGYAPAETIASRLPVGIERSVLFLGISQQAEAAADREAAMRAVTLAIQGADSISDSRKPFLLLATAGQLARFDPAAAASVRSAAITAFNKQDDLELQKVSWDRQVEVGPLVEKFPIAIKGVDFDFSSAFSAAANGSLDEMLGAASEIRNEPLKAQAFVEIAKRVFNGIKDAPQTERVLRVEEDGIRKSASKSVMPDYPGEAVKEKKQGIAVTELQYNGKGDVTDVKVVESPAPSIASAVTDAVKQWKFKPTTVKGEPVSVRGKLTFYFVIDSEGKSRVNNPKQFQ